MDNLSKLVARAEIQDCIARYARGVDRRDWATVRAAYHDDATDEHGDFKGDADGFVSWVSERQADVPFAVHFLGNSLIEFAGEDQAIAETYYIARQRLAGSNGGGEIDVEVNGRYLDLFEKRDGVWRVAHRRVVRDAMRRQPATTHADVSGAVGTRDDSDPIYDLYRRVGLAPG